MTLSAETQTRIDSIVQDNKVVLFMKGNRQQPQCGFSATVIGILNNLTSDYDTVNVLEDPEIREGIKAYSEWPTIPQLYIDGEFVGGCDLVQQMYTSGGLHEALGIEIVEVEPPQVTISDKAAAAIESVCAQQPQHSVHLKIDAKFNHEFSMAPKTGHEIAAKTNIATEILFDRDSAARADGLELDLVEGPQGTGFSIRNPNAPEPAPQMAVETLKQKMDAGEAVHLFDVRGPDEHAIAHIEGARLLDEDAVAAIDALSRDALLVFHCHSGVRSQNAANYFVQHGFTNVHNLEGGIDAWSQRVDPSVPRY